MPASAHFSRGSVERNLGFKTPPPSIQDSKKQFCQIWTSLKGMYVVRCLEASDGNSAKFFQSSSFPP